MRNLKLIAWTAVLLALSASAQAGAIPFRYAWTGPVYMHIHDVSTGTQYNGKFVDGTFAPVGVWLRPGGTASDGNVYPALDSTPGNNVKPGEDGWSIFAIDSIYKGVWLGANTIAPTDLGNPLYIHGDPDPVTGTQREVVGTVFNRHDLLVRFNADGSFNFEAAGDVMEVWVQDLGTYGTLLGSAGSSGRVGLQDKYAGIGYDASGNPLSHAKLSMRLVSVTDYFGDENPDAVAGLHRQTEVRGQFTPSVVVPGTGSGDNDEYLRVVTPQEDPGYSEYGYDWELFDSNRFDPQRSWGSIRADLRVHITNTPIGARPNPNYDWLVQSSDPVTGDLVPEPVTVLGMFLGIGSVSAYIRRRSK